MFNKISTFSYKIFFSVHEYGCWAREKMLQTGKGTTKSLSKKKRSDGSVSNHVEWFVRRCCTTAAAEKRCCCFCNTTGEARTESSKTLQGLELRSSASATGEPSRHCTYLYIYTKQHRLLSLFALFLSLLGHRHWSRNWEGWEGWKGISDPIRATSSPLLSPRARLFFSSFSRILIIMITMHFFSLQLPSCMKLYYVTIARVGLLFSFGLTLASMHGLITFSSDPFSLCSTWGWKKIGLSMKKKKKKCFRSDIVKLGRTESRTSHRETIFGLSRKLSP